MNTNSNNTGSSLCELNGPLTSMQRAKKMRITDLNPYLTCRLCNGYLVDATTIIECLHSFCKTCIVKFLQEKEEHKYCPTCEVQMHKTKPLLSIRSDKTLQDIVYKLVPGLFKAEMKRRRDFYAEHPDSAVSQLSTPEDRGLVHEEHFIYTPDEDISLSLEHWTANVKHVANNGFSSEATKTNLDATGSAKVDDTSHRRYLRCTAAVTVAHLKKLIRLKYELPSLYKVDIIHQNDVLCEDYTLVDVAYIYSWRRNGPMRFFYRIEEQYRTNPAKRPKLSATAEPDRQPAVSSGPEVVWEREVVTATPATSVVSVTDRLQSDLPQPPTPSSSSSSSKVTAAASPMSAVVKDATPARNVAMPAPILLAKDPLVSLAKIPSSVPAATLPQMATVSIAAAKPRAAPKVTKSTAAAAAAAAAGKTKGGREKKTAAASAGSSGVGVGLKKVVVNLKAPVNNPMTVVKRFADYSCNGDGLCLQPSSDVVNVSKENCESELQLAAATTLVSIGTKETKTPDAYGGNGGTKDSTMVVVVVASNEPPETPMSSVNAAAAAAAASCVGASANHLHLGVSPSPPPQLQLPVPDISITPIPPSPQRSQLSEVPLKLSLPREALLATNPQVEIIKKVSPFVVPAVTVTTTVLVTSPVDSAVTTAASPNNSSIAAPAPAPAPAANPIVAPVAAPAATVTAAPAVVPVAAVVIPEVTAVTTVATVATVSIPSATVAVTPSTAAAATAVAVLTTPVATPAMTCCTTATVEAAVPAVEPEPEPASTNEQNNTTAEVATISSESPEVAAVTTTTTTTSSTTSAATVASTTVATTTLAATPTAVVTSSATSDSTTETIAVTSTPSPETVESVVVVVACTSNGTATTTATTTTTTAATNAIVKDFVADEAPPKHDNIGALDLSKNSRAIGLSRRSLTPSSTPPPRSPTSRSSPPTPTMTMTAPAIMNSNNNNSSSSSTNFHAPPSLSNRVPAQAHVHAPVTTTKTASAAITAVTVTVPQLPPSTFHPPISRSVPASLSSAAARPLFMSGRTTRPNMTPPRPTMTPLPPSPQQMQGGNSYKVSNNGNGGGGGGGGSNSSCSAGLNGISGLRTYSHHRHGAHHQHGGSGSGNGSSNGGSGGAAHGHSSRAVPKHILSAIGMLAVKKPDYVSRMSSPNDKANVVSAKPAVLSAGLGNFRNGGTKVDTSSSSV